MDILKSRRRFLAGLAAVGIYGPLTQFGLARLALAGQSQQAKLKVAIFVVPDGTAVDSSGAYSSDGRGLWHPQANELDTSSFQLNEVSQELAAYKNQSLYLRGTILGPGNEGHNGWTWLLRDREKKMASIDVLLGQHMPGTDPAQRSLFAGPHAGIDGTPWYVSWNGPQSGGGIRTPVQDPELLAQTIFGTVSREVRERQTRNRHVFDPVLADINELRGRLSGAQKQKLDTQLDAVEQTLKNMDETLPPIGECSPLQLEPVPFKSAQFRNQIQDSHHQVVATALACGITRVATIQVGRSAESLNILDVSDVTNPHDCAHRFAGLGVWKSSRQWYVQRLKLFMDELARHADPDVPGDSLLKHTLVVFTSEMADGAPEHTLDMPLVLMGGASGLLKSGNGAGRYFNITAQGDRQQYGNPVIGNTFVDMQRIWATIAKAAGTSVPYSGNIDPVSGIFTNV
ncbi:DUF1552 domain-containing protein [Pseudomonas palleroniana]|uniref:DUF1552 domain-containing protein n=1 Tax=Pseudomonas palleroniana TaxID=191390 RepID=UPI0018E67268|nr:DUF1552 domain-containing protein [Pseudomonas palleroniana]MBI6912119.1 DUF1552 domain-containing protein [Pseudomonas palleroniana]